MKYFLSIAMLVGLLYSCKDDTVIAPSNNNATYFPLDKGSWIVYACDSIVHLTDDDNTGQTDTSIVTYHFQIKEVIDSSFIDGEGSTAFYVSRYKRVSDTLSWDFQAEWVAKLTSSSAQRVEDNIRYVKLAFPISASITWNGNAYNHDAPEDYSYTDIHVPSTFGALSFDSTVTVLQLRDYNQIHQIYKQEKYANHVGLVYKQRDSLNVVYLSGNLNILNGIQFRETIISFGH